MDFHASAFRVPERDDEPAPLRPIDWAGLVARLGAERDLRRELASRIGGGEMLGASFAGAAALALDPPAQGQSAINPDALADGKANGGISPAAGADTSPAGIEARGQR